MNCAAIPSELIESELFGHMKGSFTGAVERSRGKFEQADGGTLFLDEVGDMSLAAQAKVLRVLQDGEVTRIGGEQAIKVDVRVLAATNKNLEEEIAAGRFREDLYYRLNVVPLHVPPLRDRREDIPAAGAALRRPAGAPRGRTGAPARSHRRCDALQSLDWPGNVRELRNTIERLLILLGRPAHHGGRRGTPRRRRAAPDGVRARLAARMPDVRGVQATPPSASSCSTSCENSTGT